MLKVFLVNAVRDAVIYTKLIRRTTVPDFIPGFSPSFTLGFTPGFTTDFHDAVTFT